MNEKCIMNIKLFLNDDGTICLGVMNTDIDAKISIFENILVLDLEGACFKAAINDKKPVTFKTSRRCK